MDVAVQAPWAITPEKVEQAVRRLVVAGRSRKIILFGSYVRGETHRDSDLDVLVVAPEGIGNTRAESARLRGALTGIPMCMDILVVRERDFHRLKDRIGLVYREAARRGKVVYEAAEGGVTDADVQEWVAHAKVDLHSARLGQGEPRSAGKPGGVSRATGDREGA